MRGPGQDTSDDYDAYVAGSNLNTGASAKSLPGPRTDTTTHRPDHLTGDARTRPHTLLPAP
jgi:hypothetical protein